MFDKAKARIDTMVNDRITAPVRTSIVIASGAFIIALIALAVAMNKGK